MPEFSDEEIAREAYRIWEAEGRSLWSHASDHWGRAIESLRRLAAGGDSDPAAAPMEGTGQEQRI